MASEYSLPIVLEKSTKSVDLRSSDHGTDAPGWTTRLRRYPYCHRL